MPFLLSTYIPAPALLELYNAEDRLEDAIASLRRAHVSEVILEGRHGAHSVPEEALAALRDAFEAKGVAAAGALAAAPGDGGIPAEGLEARFATLCFTRDDTVARLEEEVVKLARLFRKVVLAGGLMTACRCAQCEAQRAGRGRSAFRTELLSQVSQRLTRAARLERPDVRVTVRFPPYYDRRRQFGYDARRFVALYDAIWVGVETRSPQIERGGWTEPYQGYFNVEWMRQCAGDAFDGVWLDQRGCDEQVLYELGVTASLSSPREIVLGPFDPGAFSGSRVARFTASLPQLERLAHIAKGPRGVHVVKPPNSRGGRDLYLFDYLGMLGVPCVPVTRVDSSMRSVFVTAHSIDDEDIRLGLQRALLAGRRVTATFDALRRMARYPDLLEFFGYAPSAVAPGRTLVERLRLPEGEVRLEAPFHIAGDLAPHEAAVTAEAVIEREGRQPLTVPFITSRTFASGGRAVVWNLGTFGKDAFTVAERLRVPRRPELFNLPKGAVDFLRNSLLHYVGFAIDAPPRVASFVFKEHLVFVNYKSSAAEVEVRGLQFDAASLKADSPTTACSGNSLILAPRSHASLRYAAPAS